MRRPQTIASRVALLAERAAAAGFLALWDQTTAYVDPADRVTAALRVVQTEIDAGHTIVCVGLLERAARDAADPDLRARIESLRAEIDQ